MKFDDVIVHFCSFECIRACTKDEFIDAEIVGEEGSINEQEIQMEVSETSKEKQACRRCFPCLVKMKPLRKRRKGIKDELHD